MMMALAGEKDLPGLIIPGGVTLPARGAEDAARSSPSARASPTG